MFVAQGSQPPMDVGIAIIANDKMTGRQREVHYASADKATQIGVLSSLIVKTAVAYATQKDEVCQNEVLTLII